MGILDDLGVGESIPKIDITGFFSASWIYIAIIVVVGIILVGLAISFYLF